MIRPALSVAAFAFVIPASPANACGSFSVDWHSRTADIAAEGNVSCEPALNECELQVTNALKAGDTGSLPRTVQITADYDKQQVEVSEDRITVFCTPIFQPEERQFFGRFYLRRLDTGRYRVSLSLRPDESGKYPDF